MEFNAISKIIFGVFASIGTIAVTLFNLEQGKKIKAELIEKLDLAIKKYKKHSVSELFRLIHGIRLKYSDIVELVEKDECSNIIYAIKRTPRIVTFENGKLKYTKVGRNRYFQILSLWINRLGILFFSAFYLLSYFIFYFKTGTIAIMGCISFLLCLYMLIMHFKEIEYDEMISNLIEREAIKIDSDDRINRD